jgi:ATP-dependent Clp protease ATP-binding subunit ClpA
VLETPQFDRPADSRILDFLAKITPYELFAAPTIYQVSPPPDEVYPSKETSKILDSAAKIMKERKDSYLAVDALILAVLGASDVGTALQEAGVPKMQLEDAVKEVRLRVL